MSYDDIEVKDSQLAYYRMTREQRQALEMLLASWIQTPVGWYVDLLEVDSSELLYRCVRRIIE